MSAVDRRDGAGSDEIVIRRYERPDEDAVLQLLGASLGWVPDDQHVQFFRWKHQQNPFGASPAWVAESDGVLVGFRVLMPWDFVQPGRAEPVRAVRAVDTATHPDLQGRGIFRRLTLHAVEEMRGEGIDLIFNTPNERSRPGYLKMGWETVGRLPIAARPRSLRSLLRVARARVPAEKWSQPSSAGHPASSVLDDHRAIAHLLRTMSSAKGLATSRSPAYLSWRYGFEPLRYRAVIVEDDPSKGLAVFRLRRRGDALEAALCELLVPAGRGDVARRLVRQVLREARPDHLVAIGADGARLVPLPRQGPVLVRRDLATGAEPPPQRWSLTLGDIELM
jgi:GNAT superfamily N-acetyltransferase